MIITVTNEVPFQILSSSFSIGPSQTGYELQVGADSKTFSTLFSVGANTPRMVTNVANGSYFRLKNNVGDVKVNWQRVCVTDGGGGASGTELSPVSEFPAGAEAGTVIAYSGSSSASGVYQYDGNEWTEVGADIDLSAYWTSAETQSALTAVEDHLFDVEEVTASALTELHNAVLELSANTPDLSGFWTSAETQSYVEGQGFAYEEDVEEIAQVTAGAINQLQEEVSEKTEFRKHAYVSLDSLASSIEYNQAFFDVDESGDTVSNIDFSKAGEIINIGDMRSDMSYPLSINPDDLVISYDAEENMGELIPAGSYSLAFSKIAEGVVFTGETFRVAIGGSDSEDIETLNVTTTTGNTIREAIEKYNNDWALTRDRVFIVDQDGFPTEWFFKDDVRYFEIRFYEDGVGNFGYEINIEYANTVHTKDDGFGLIKNIMKIEQSAYDALVNDGITDPETLYVVVPDSN